MSARLLRLCLPLGMLVVMVAPVASVAGAATVTVGKDSDGERALVYVAAPGELNRVVVAPFGEDGLKITDTGAVIAASGRCRSLDAHTAVCRAAYLVTARLSLGDLDDRAAPSPPTRDMWLMVDGGTGDDTLTASGDFATLDGGPGNDQLYASPCCIAILRGGEGNDVLDGDRYGGELEGGAGDDLLLGGDEPDPIGWGDTLDGGGGHDELHGGGGNDVLLDGDRDGAAAAAAPGPDTLDGGGDWDTVSYQHHNQAVRVHVGDDANAGELGEGDKTTGIENVIGGAGDDRLVGDQRRNHLDGRGGDDTLIGAAGADTLEGGPGTDQLRAGAGRDRLLGGPGIDLLSCGTGEDMLKNVVSAHRAREIVPEACEQLEFLALPADVYPSGDSPWRDEDALWVDPHPTSTQAWWLNVRAACPWFEGPPFIPCWGRVIMRESRGGHRLLGRGSFSHPADGANFNVGLALTTRGYRWSTGRLRRAYATITLYMTAESTSRRPLNWTIQPPH